MAIRISQAAPVLAIAGLLTGLFATAAAHGETRADLLTRYEKIFRDGSEPAQIEAVQALEWLGLSEPQIFDPAEKNLAGRMADPSKEGAFYASYLARALGYSGQEKYRGTLTQLASAAANKKLRRYADTALLDLANYARWNPIIASTSAYDPDKSPELNAFANMLRSTEPGLHLLAAKRVYHDRLQDTALLGLLEIRARPAATQPASTPDEIETVAWMLKALAATRKPEYRPIVETAAASGGHEKVRKYAEKYLRSYYPSERWQGAVSSHQQA